MKDELHSWLAGCVPALVRQIINIKGPAILINCVHCCYCDLWLWSAEKEAIKQHKREINFFTAWLSVNLTDTCHLSFANIILLKGSPPGSKTKEWPKPLFRFGKVRSPKPAIAHRELRIISSALSTLANSLFKTPRGKCGDMVVINWFFRILARLIWLVVRNCLIWLLIQRTQYWNYWGKE